MRLPRPEPVTIDLGFSIANPVLQQSWRQLTFLHWGFDPLLSRPLMPLQLELDLWEGRAYVGLVSFVLANIGPLRLTAIPWLSRFPETNARKYARDETGRRGVWFY